MIWDALPVTIFWQMIDPKAMTICSDNASLSYHTPLKKYLNGKMGPINQLWCNKFVPNPNIQK